MPTVIPCITQTKAEARAELATMPGVTPEWIERHVAALPGDGSELLRRPF
jgi:hypothetical protein